MKQGFLPDSSVYSTQDYTDLRLDSLELEIFVETHLAGNDTLARQVHDFYARRTFQYAWFQQSGISDVALTFYNQLKNYSSDFADNSLASVELDTLMDLVQADTKAILKNQEVVKQTEMYLTATFFRYAQRVYGGLNKNLYDLEWFIPRKKKNYNALLDSMVSAKNNLFREPENRYYTQLKAKLKNYRILQKMGGFPAIRLTKQTLVQGESDSTLVQLKSYLRLTGDLKTNENSTIFTDSLTHAIKQFQYRMGLSETGKLTSTTLQELNQPIEVRIKQMMVNLERLRWMPEEVENKFLLVNIPEFKLHVFENRKQVLVTNVVVGKNATKTVIFKGNISQVILNPYWIIPSSIVKNEILPKIKRNPAYLARNNMEVVNGVYRQKPGKNNALGRMKFLFPNSYSIYLHDTPSKSLFKESNRAFSHGCIRVENPIQVALFLLSNQSDWNIERLNALLETTTETAIRVAPTCPVYITYFTSWVDSAGLLHFRNDLYKLDTKLSKEIFSE